MNFAADENLIRQYLQDDDIARDFAAYYQLYAKYRQDYHITELLSGSLEENTVSELCQLASHAPSDERLTVAGLLLDGWNTYFLNFHEEDLFAVALQDTLKQARLSLLQGNTLADFAEQYRASAKIKQANHLLSDAETDRTERIAKVLEEALVNIRQNRISDSDGTLEVLRQTLARAVQCRQNLASQASLALKKGFSFAEKAFRNGPEILFLISDLSHNPNAISFIRIFGCEEYFQFNDHLKFQEKRENLLQEIDSVLGNPL